jgi:hypothetical protein
MFATFPVQFLLVASGRADVLSDSGFRATVNNLVGYEVSPMGSVIADVG